jgi:hypothetical protein
MKVRKILSGTAVALSCLNILEVGFFIWVLCLYHDAFPLSGLLVSIFINFSSVFFSVALIIAVVTQDESLLKVWLVYSLVELSRTCMTLYESSEHTNDEYLAKTFNSWDVALHVMLIFIVIALLTSLLRRSKTKLEISTISFNVEPTNSRHHCQ